MVVEHVVVVVEESVAVVSSEFPASRMTATTVAARMVPALMTWRVRFAVAPVCPRRASTRAQTANRVPSTMTVVPISSSTVARRASSASSAVATHRLASGVSAMMVHFAGSMPL